MASSRLIWPLSEKPKWQARWIAPAGAADRKNVYFRARRTFTLRAVPESARLHIAAESLYRLWVNGEPVGAGPVRGTATRNYADTYEIAPLLRPGENGIAVLVGCHNAPGFKYAPSAPALFVQAEGMDVHSGSEWEVQTAADWREDVPFFTFQMGFMEWRDLRREPRGWTRGQDDGAWEAPEVIVGSGPDAKLLLPRDIPALAEQVFAPVAVSRVAAIPPASVPDDTAVARLLTTEAHLPREDEAQIAHRLLHPEEGPLRIASGGGIVLVFDFGREITGGLEIEVDAPAGTLLDVGYEETAVDGRLRLWQDGASYAFADRFVLREGRQTAGPTLAERGFRMVQIALRGDDRPMALHAVRAVDRRYPVPDAAAFRSGDAELDAIHDRCVETLSTCATDTFTDCPWRESALWVNDLIVENQTWLQAFGDGRLNARCLRLALSQPSASGLVPGVCPTSGEVRLVFPATNLYLPRMLEEYWLHTGDRGLVEEALPALRRILDAFAVWEDADGLVTPPAELWNFVDWSLPFNGVSLDGRCSAVVNWFYVYGLDTAARLLDRLGRDGGEPLRARAARVAGGIERRFWDQSRGLYVEFADGGAPVATRITQALAVLSCRLSSPRYAAVAAALDGADALPPELYLYHLVFRALTATGQADRALRRIRQYWGPMIASGSPTIWEANVHQSGKEAFGGFGSLCHGFATAPVSFFQTVLLGVRPLEPGFARFSVEPAPLDLDRASGTVPTPRGPIVVSWRREGDRLRLELTVPDGTEAVLPGGAIRGAGKYVLAIPGSVDGVAAVS